MHEDEQEILQKDFEQEDFHFHTVFDYGEHTANEPIAGETVEWEVRHDPFSDHRAGFEIRTYRRCKRVISFHQEFDELPNPCEPVSEVSFTYNDQPDRGLRVWDTNTGELVLNINSDVAMSPEMDFTPDGKQIVVFDGDGDVTIFDAQTGDVVGEPVNNLLRGTRNPFALNPKGTSFVGANNINTIYIYSLTEDQLIYEINSTQNDPITNLIYS